MAYQLTPWGYEVDGDLPPLLDARTFHQLTGNRWRNDARVEPALLAASATVRNWCGWHVGPSMACRAVLDADGTKSLWLPTRCLTAITSVTANGSAVTDYQWSRIGQVLPKERIAPGLRAATVEYTAGIDVTGDLANLVRYLVERNIAMSYGVTSETVGDASVSRSSAAAMAGGTTQLMDSDRAALAPYKVVRAHAS